ncbi:hypothetical protein [Synergistes jonesii]|uniref:hypothetical protein n=2 Tax=Synergistes jonesii TaxID=2754 RepID=UPI001267B8F4|nr:hypothetical protein [Synergistes jonesii]
MTQQDRGLPMDGAEAAYPRRGFGLRISKAGVRRPVRRQDFLLGNGSRRTIIDDVRKLVK